MIEFADGFRVLVGQQSVDGHRSTLGCTRYSHRPEARAWEGTSLERMRTARILHHVSDADRRAVLGLLAAGGTSGRLDDLLVTDLSHGPRDGFVAVVAEVDGTTVGYAQASMGNDGYVVGVITVDGADESPVRLLAELLGALPSGAEVTWWPAPDDPVDATAIGLAPGRRLLQMSVPLPLAAPSPYAASELALRAFRPGIDDEEWLAVNNAAFHWHGEQGGWDLSTLHQRLQEPWFRPDGFLLHHRGGRLAAFCWTKLHDPDDDLAATIDGEIYVIAVHPDFHGLGLGRALTVAGLQHLHASGATHGMLFVDAANEPAIALYRSLGFAVRRTLQAYQRPPEERSS
ncbi:MAG TPA: mycothiol synthase [Acidimicrobiaceae bacterium]|nr:mycothiol synthase [Acidimicrobiaceae bacterium]